MDGTINITMQNQILKAELFGSGMLTNMDRYSRINITHIPVMITESNKILCLPDSGETSHIGISAMTGKGKGICGNTILGFKYWMKNRPCLILNDFQQETFENSFPSMNKVFNTNLNLINAKPMPYPIVYVLPSNKDLIIEETERKFPHLKMSLPTHTIIENVGNYYKLDKSGKYVTANIDKFIECGDLEEIKEVLNEIIPNARKFEEMKYKLEIIFKNIFDEKICDSTTPDAPAYLTVKKRGMPEYRNLTIQALLYAGLIPSIQTSEIRTKDWFAEYMRFIVSSIYWDKYKDPFLSNTNLTMYIPEIDKMWKGENGELIKKELCLMGTNGRRAGIEMIWDAQDYNAVPDAIRNNTKFLFVLRKNHAEEVREIKKDFNVDKETEGVILSLNTDPGKGIFECVALTTDKFFLYNMKDGSISTTSAPQRGRLITPMSQHKIPGVRIKQLIDNN